MVTVEIDVKDKRVLTEIRKRSNVPEGYMTAEEWRTRCKKNISEIFRKNSHGLL